MPLIIVSPYAKPGFTDTTATSFAGILASTEHNFGLSPLGPNENHAHDFSNAFDYSQVPLKAGAYGAAAAPRLGETGQDDPGAAGRPVLDANMNRPGQPAGPNRKGKGT